MQFQKYSNRGPVVVTPLKTRDGRRAKGWLVRWQDALGGSDANISARAKDALLLFLQNRDMTRITKLKLKVRRKR